MLLRRLLVTLALACGLVAVPTAAQAATYSAPFTTAISDLPVATESRTGYSRDLFPHWVDADGDGCSTRNEVLIAEADDPVTVGSGCSLSGGRWFSYYDRVSWTDPGRIDIDHMVPLAEAWDSGAGSWTTAVRQSYANDLGDSRSLVGVTDSVNQAKGDQDPNEWMPTVRQVPLPARVGRREAPLAADRGQRREERAPVALCRLLERHDHGHPRPAEPRCRLLAHESSTARRPVGSLHRAASPSRRRSVSLPSVSDVPDLPARLIDEETT